MSMSLGAEFVQLDLHIKACLRLVLRDDLPREDKRTYDQVKLACKELRLDLRDYEYAETRAEQHKWAKLARHNLRTLEVSILALPDVFKPVDVAELSAGIDHIRSQIY